MMFLVQRSKILLLLLATLVVKGRPSDSHTLDESNKQNEDEIIITSHTPRLMRGATQSAKVERDLEPEDDSIDIVDKQDDVVPYPSSGPDNGSDQKMNSPTGPVQYLARPHALSALSKLFAGRISPASIGVNPGSEEQDHVGMTQDTVVDEDDLASFFGLGAVSEMSYGYDTAPPTMKLSESPTPAVPERRPITDLPTMADGDLLVNESPVSLPVSRSVAPTPYPSAATITLEPTYGEDDDLLTNEITDPPFARPFTSPPTPEQSYELTSENTNGVHTPSLRPTVWLTEDNPALTSAPTATCFPPCTDDEICRGGEKKGSCYPKCKSKKRCYDGDVCRSDGYCDKCRACKDFKKKQCCSVDLEMCREVVPAKKIDKCFDKCAYDEDCSDLIPRDPEDICLLDGGCSRRKSKKAQYYDKYADKANKYVNKETVYVAKEDKYANKNGRRLEEDESSTSNRSASTILRGTRRRVPRRRTLYSHEMEE